MHAKLATGTWAPEIALALVAVSLWVAGELVFHDNLLAAAPLALAGFAGVAFVFWQGMLRRPWAVVAIVAGAVTLLSISFQQRDLGHVGLTPQNVLKIGAWTGMLAISAMNFRRLGTLLNDPPILAFACYCCICLFSAAYSTVPAVSLMAALAQIAYLGFACVVADAITERTLLKTLLWSLAAFSAVNLLSAVVAPDLAYFHTDAAVDPDDLRFMGITGHPNSLGRIAAIFAVIVFANAYRRYVRPAVWLPMAMLALFIVMATFSRTAIIALLLALVLQLPRRLFWPAVLVAASVALMAGLSGQLDNILALLGRNGDLGELRSMSGRTDVWSFAGDLIARHPLVGYGFNSYEAYAGRFWTGPLESIAEAHSNYLQILYATGIFGIIPFAAGFAILLYRWVVRPDPVRDVLVLNVLINGFSESDVFSSISVLPTFVFCLIIAMDSARKIKLIKRHNA